MEQNNTSAPRHTAGPWVIDGVCVYAQPYKRETKYQDEDGNEQSFTHGLVALVYSCGSHRNMPANAQLIAAAPELKDRLIELLDMLDGGASLNTGPARQLLDRISEGRS